MSLLVQGYERLSGETAQPGSPERVFIQWVASILTHERVLMNYTGNQNIPSRAEGENLDALAELMYLPQRPQAAAAVCTQRFYISEPQESAILVPKGTRVTSSGGPVWETAEDAYISIGDSYTDAQVRCQTLGAAGNGYTPGQINTLVDIYDYYSKTENLTASDGGADEATDEEFYELMRASMDGYSCAGARGSYSGWGARKRRWHISQSRMKWSSLPTAGLTVINPAPETTYTVDWASWRKKSIRSSAARPPVPLRRTRAR